MKFNVLVFPSNSQPAIDINFALRHAVRVEVYGGSSTEDHGKYVYQNYIPDLPNISQPDFILSLNEVVRKNNIHFIIPTHDTVALYLKENEERIAAQIVCSDLETTKICRSKSLTYSYLTGFGFVPKIYSDPSQIKQYPVFLKPDKGQGAKGTNVINNEKELEFYYERTPDLLICEFLPGEELTVDCFTDRQGILRFVGPRTRTRVLAGISVSSRQAEITEEVNYIAKSLNSTFSFRGYWYFQVKRDRQGIFKLLEISTRFAGTACLHFARDVNLPLLSILDYAGFDVEFYPNDYDIEVDRSFINRYMLNVQYERVYVDLDDTLLVKGICNQFLIMLLYQCVNQKREVILITKHGQDVSQTLAHHRIAIDLFDEIIHLSKTENKFEFMKTDKPAIFIDNSYAERKAVRSRLGFPCFDVNSVDVLIDWRG
ncbi:ATP-grasp domain-containing protein [Brevibacillus panacihumi]|uniref:ATP-grasp domain-containing protein n=1 Tax=Brevibacillus panacihumi TaxID=497735 RepID=UPI003D20FB64